MHPEDPDTSTFDLPGRRALVVCTNHAVLDIGKADRGVRLGDDGALLRASSTPAWTVDVASPLGGTIPVDPHVPQAGAPLPPTDDRFLGRRRAAGQGHRTRCAIGELDMDDYDIVYLAGGWGAAFDFGTSDTLATKVTEANAAGLVIGGVCHGPLGLPQRDGPRRPSAGRGPPGERP